MNREEFTGVLEAAAQERGCRVVGLEFDDDENVFEVTIDREDPPVDIKDCEFVHRALLAAFDRNIEDYSLTVSSAGMDSAEADELLANMK